MIRYKNLKKLILKRQWHSRADDSGSKCPRFEPRTVHPLFGENLGTCKVTNRSENKKKD